MINVKSFVLCISIVGTACSAKYCEICSDHTLCKYNRPGPSAACLNYETSLLKESDITDIVNRINEKRNLVALGLSRKLPEAANMRAISWSEELATFAQRWADQCDPFTRPNRHDVCRDLKHTAVGQNIATISGPSPGLHVKSFIDMWFIQILDYNGSVSYYNQSRDGKTNYFTQLIWAETDIVGCGRAKFFTRDKKTMIERLVCNFAPTGNIDGKPVYTIGYAATQCPENMTPDMNFKGLCRFLRNEILYTSTNLPVSSLLRILNLSNNSTKQDIDPIKNKLRQMKIEGNKTSDQRNQKIRHIYNNTHVGLPHAWPQQMYWHNAMNISRNHGLHSHHQERGHSRLYHGHEHKDNFMTQYKGSSNQDFRKYDHATKPLNSFSSADYRKHFQHCTRRDSAPNDCFPTTNGCVSRCTRGQNNDCCQSTPPCQTQTKRPIHVYPHDECLCNTQRTTCVSSSKCPCQCPYVPVNAPMSSCPNIGRMQDEDEIKDDTRKSSELHYYDFLPNLAIRSGDTVSYKSSDRNTKKKPWLFRSTSDDKHLTSETFLSKRRDYNRNSGRVKDVLEYAKYIDQEYDYSYGSFDSSERIRRQQSQDQMTFKPFWQMDEYNQKQLKALRYTTLQSKRNRKSWKTPLYIVTEPITITLQDSDGHRKHGDHVTEKYLSFDELLHLRKFSSEDIDGRRKADQTKLALRKTPAEKEAEKKRKEDEKKKKEAAKKQKEEEKKKKEEEKKKKEEEKKKKEEEKKKKEAEKKKKEAEKAKKEEEKRKKEEEIQKEKDEKLKKDKDKAEKQKDEKNANEKKDQEKQVLKKAIATDEYTTNTPFERKKHCTRKLTCTWTAPTVTGVDGKVIKGSGVIGIGGGSRTPPGYVDGCTRTSTCTRDFMNRNKMVTIPNQISGDSDTTGEEDLDEDYCEKRDLNIQRRNLGDDATVHRVAIQDAFTDVPTSTEYINEVSKSITDQNGPKSSKTDCVCYDGNLRKKRDSIRCSNYGILSQKCFGNTFSYGDLYYVILKKIMKNLEEKSSHRCACNTGCEVPNSVLILLLILYTTLI